jgi:hypothetical protein
MELETQLADTNMYWGNNNTSDEKKQLVCGAQAQRIH